MSLQKSSQVMIIQNQRYINERVSGILGLWNNNFGKPSDILGIKEKG